LTKRLDANKQWPFVYIGTLVTPLVFAICSFKTHYLSYWSFIVDSKRNSRAYVLHILLCPITGIMMATVLKSFMPHSWR